jgi:hypothetical protein
MRKKGEKNHRKQFNVIAIVAPILFMAAGGLFGEAVTGIASALNGLDMSALGG